jgi:hypothetical protein
VWSLQLSIKAAKGESIDEPEDIDKEIALLKTELKGENVLNATATPDSICDAMEQNIIPLFMMIEEKIKSLKEFFFKVKREITYESKGEGGTRMVGTINSKWDSIKQNWLTKRIRGEAKKLEHIKYIYTLEGFKKSIAANSLSLIIDVSFYEYNYTIQFDDNKNQPKLIPYGVMVDIEELRSFIMPAIKDILEKIKELNQKSKVK